MTKVRSWDSFGTALMGLGFSVILITVVIFDANQYSSVTSVIVAAVFVLMGLFITFVGFRISRWDKSGKAKMRRIDRKLAYRFFLTFKGREEEVKDFSVIEEALTALDLGKETWSLKIDPPMGTLSGWKGYYDAKKKLYVSEITFVRKEGIRKGMLYFDYDCIDHLRSKLKRLVVDKKKVSF